MWVESLHISVTLYKGKEGVQCKTAMIMFVLMPRRGREAAPAAVGVTAHRPRANQHPHHTALSCCTHCAVSSLAGSQLEWKVPCFVKGGRG